MMNGVPLVATSPVKHEPNGNYQGYEVTRYQVRAQLDVLRINEINLNLIKNIPTAALESILDVLRCDRQQSRLQQHARIPAFSQSSEIFDGSIM